MSFFSSLSDKEKGKGKVEVPITKLPSSSEQKSLPEKEETEVRLPSIEQPPTKIIDQESWLAKKIPIWKPGDIILEHYEIEDVIESGGMGRIYVADHRNWKVKVAIKSPTEEMLQDRDYFSRVQKEAEAWTELGLHPNVVYCYFVRNIEDVPHLFVEYVDGGNLRQWIEDGRCSDLKTGLDLAIQFCHGMAYAHSKGMIHRDIKPENILMTQDGTLKITDFGIARWGKKEKEEESGKDLIQKGDDTRTIGFIGTKAYASPEQLEDAHSVGLETDIFSFGLCLWEMLCGRKPYYIAAVKEKIPNPRKLRPDFPESLHILLKQFVAFERKERQELGGFENVREQFKAIYQELFNEPSPHSELEKIDLKADGFNNRGVSYLELGKFQEAAKCLKNALDIFPHHVEAFYNNELLSWRQGLKTDMNTITTFDSLKDLIKNKARHHLLLAQLFMEQSNPRDAVTVLQEALEIHPSMVELWEKLGEAYLYLSDLDAALTAFKRASALSSENQRLRYMIKNLEHLHYIPPEYAGCFWKELDFSNTFASGKEHLTFHGDTQRILLRTSDKKHLAVAGIFNLLPSFELPEKEVGYVSRASFSIDGKSLLLIGTESINVWSLEKNRLLKIIPLSKSWHFNVITDPLLCPDGTILLASMGSGKERPAVYSCPPDRTEFIRLCLEPGGDIASLDIDYTNRRILTGSRDGACRLWSMDTGFGQCFYYNRNGITSTSFSQGYDLCITCSRDGITTVWHKGGDRKVREFVTHPDYAVAASLRTNNSILATLNTKWRNGKQDLGHIHIWEMDSGRCLSTITGINCDFNPKLEFSEDNTLLFVFSSKSGLRAWRLPCKFPKARYEFCQPQTAHEIASADKKAERIILKAQESLRQGNDKRVYLLLRSVQEDANYVFDTRVVQMLRTLHRRGKRKGIRNSRCLHTMITEHKAPVTALIFLDEATALSGTIYGGLQLWDLISSNCKGMLRGHNDKIYKIIPASSGKIVVTLDEKRCMRVWDISSLECLGYFDYSGHKDIFHHLTVSTDGSKAFSTNGKNHAVVWDLEIEEMDDHFDLPLEKDMVKAMFSPDDNNIVFLEFGDHSWSRLDLRSRKCEPIEVLYTSFDVTKRQDLDARIIDNTILLCEKLTGKELITLSGHLERILSFDISEEGLDVISGDEGGTIQLWELDWELEFS